MITKAGVPGKKVVVGVTSYGRSFEMVQPGCWGPNCLFTGDRLNSNAKKGVVRQSCIFFPLSGWFGCHLASETAELLLNCTLSLHKEQDIS